mmetsp:Transcript_57437/g.136542  ORF Transcript_57437/g.136542 Transcript_57437/m.136542 type:complete len:572 (-) Transcript_57437:165-1880(-)|eukprot:CAMPEP_0178400826 /NCGR_PEP_ID=MMETSP0689_2-20121128/15988_1 /TAXON_ID=160604 /ORGANISM="Amphidinium massartii, Strain CS-259" /LENGTH=571 /DNA_ID=CAMNT_0020021631 /DNA_START=113 /DNA_END=1828 /DNA_ORIENTATION=-
MLGSARSSSRGYAAVAAAAGVAVRTSNLAFAACSPSAPLGAAHVAGSDIRREGSKWSDTSAPVQDSLLTERFLTGSKQLRRHKAWQSQIRGNKRRSRSRLPTFSNSEAAAEKSSLSSEADTVPADLPPFLQRPRNEVLWQLARPTIIIALLRTAYGIIDSYWVGLLGQVELEAMGASSFAFFLMLLLGEVAAMGVHALSSFSAGAGDLEGVGEAVLQGMWFSVLCGAIAVSLMPLLPMYFELIGVAHKPGVLASGLAYLRGITWGVVPLTASEVLVSGFKGVAVLRPVLLVNLVCVVLNFFLDPWLIWGGMGLPALGVGGAAVATNICSLVATVLSIYLLLKERIPLRWSRPSLRILSEIARIGLPVSLGGLLFTAIYIFLGRLLGTLGDSNLAALGLGHKVEALAFTVCEGFGAAAATLVGQWLGARNEHRARDAAAHAMWVAVKWMLPLMFPFVFLAAPVVRLFTQDEATVAAAASYLQICGLSFPFMAIEHVMDGALVGAGDTTPSFVLGLFLNLARLPMSLFLAKYYGVVGVWIALIISTIAKALAKRWAFNRSSLPLLQRELAVGR